MATTARSRITTAIADQFYLHRCHHGSGQRHHRQRHDHQSQPGRRPRPARRRLSPRQHHPGRGRKYRRWPHRRWNQQRGSAACHGDAGHRQQRQRTSTTASPPAPNITLNGANFDFIGNGITGTTQLVNSISVGTSNAGVGVDNTIQQTSNAALSRPLTAVATFNGIDGLSPQGSVALDASGDIFGTSASGGATIRLQCRVRDQDMGLGSSPRSPLSERPSNGAFPDGSGVVVDASRRCLRQFDPCQSGTSP